MELLSDYDYEILYHPGKANVVVDALSRKERGVMPSVVAYHMEVTTDFRTEVRQVQGDAMKEENQKSERVVGSMATLRINSEGLRCVRGSCLDS